jgi:chemotaxis protein MotB
MKIVAILVVLSGSLILSCVTPRQFKDLQHKNKDCQEERTKLKKENERLSVENTELASKIESIDRNISRFAEDSTRKTEEIDQLKSSYKQLSKRYEDLLKAQKTITEGSEAETKKLLEQLRMSQEDLHSKEDELNLISRSLDDKKNNLDKLKKELEKRNARLIELERILFKKDSAVKSLKLKVSAALLGFENQGLSVTQKNGKVYVSLEEKLLFESGSTKVGSKGINALKKLTKVLEQNPDINIMIEGHTDDVPVIPGSAFKDNWDLSVQRATSIVRILLEGSKIDPKRLIASGRGEFMPVDKSNTEEARRKNRRTEIILTPKLDELFKILETN